MCVSVCGHEVGGYFVSFWYFVLLVLYLFCFSFFCFVSISGGGEKEHKVFSEEDLEGVEGRRKHNQNGQKEVFLTR